MNDDLVSENAFAALTNQVDFIRSFYFTAAPAFESLLRKHNPVNSSITENMRQYHEASWQEAQKGLQVLGIAA